MGKVGGKPILTPRFLQLQEELLNARTKEDLMDICEKLWMPKEEFMRRQKLRAEWNAVD